MALIIVLIGIYILITKQIKNMQLVQGIITCLLYTSEDVQIAFYRTLPGLENAEFTRPAYAIEYDCIDPSNCLLYTSRCV